MLLLMNSTVMTAEGDYSAMKITEDEAVEIFNRFKDLGYESYVGYEQTAEYMSKVLGVPVSISRNETVLNDNDVMLVCKLKYRVKDPKTKGDSVSSGDFEWWVVRYRKFAF